MGTNTRVAVTGVSHWHTAMHLPALKAAGALIESVTDDDADVARRVAEEHGARHYATLEELLAASRPDALLVMGLPARVGADVDRAVEAGIPVIVEKPIGLTAEDVAPLAAKVKRAGAFVTVPLTNRYSRLWTELEQGLSDDPGARRLHAHFRVINGVPSRYRTMGVDWVLDPAVFGGGALRNLGIHAVDAFLQFVGDEEVTVRAATLHRSHDEPAIEDHASATLVSASGVVGTIEAGYTLAARGGSDTEWRVATSNAYLIDRNSTLRMVELNEGTDETVPIPTVRERYDEYIADTLVRIRHGRPPKVSLDDYVRATRLIDRIYELGLEGAAGPR